MASVMYKILNPVMKGILKSPLHGMMSSSIAVVEFTGRVSGKQMSTPASYVLKDGRVHVFTHKDTTWWKNLVDVPQATMLLGGQSVTGKPDVVVDDAQVIHKALTEFLTILPRDASFSDIGLDDNKVPIAEDVARAVPGMVYISMPMPAS